MALKGTDAAGFRINGAGRMTRARSNKTIRMRQYGTAKAAEAADAVPFFAANAPM